MKFVARTVLVRNNDVEAAYRALDRLILGQYWCYAAFHSTGELVITGL